MNVVAFAPDLMDRSKISAAVPGVRFVSLAELPGVEADVVVVDLSRPGAADAVPAGSAWVGFASHVALPDVPGGAVLPRSKFFADIAGAIAAAAPGR